MPGKSMQRLIFILLATLLLQAGLADSAVAQGPSGISEPQNGAIVQGSLHIKGVANDPRFAAWQLDLLPGGAEESAIFLGRETSAQATVGGLKRLDTYLYPNGAYRLRLRVIKIDGNYDEYAVWISINNTTPVPLSSITTPESGSVVNCTIAVKGFANDPIFRKWQLDLLPKGNEDKAIFLDRGSSVDSAERTFAQVDTRAYPDGDYRLRLRVVGQDGQYDSYYSWIAIDNSALSPACNCPSKESSLVPAANGIAHPLDGATVAGKFLVCGVADDPIFSTWQLDLLFEGEVKLVVPVARGKSPNKVSAPLTELDATPLPPGKYGLRLSISRLDYTYDEQTVFFYVADLNPGQVP